MAKDRLVYKVVVNRNLWQWLISQGNDKVNQLLTECYEKSKQSEADFSSVKMTDVTADDDYWKEV